MSEGKGRRPVLDLQTNLPVVVTMKYADWFVHETYGEKLKAAVNVSPQNASDAYPAGDYTLFFFPGAEEGLLALGAISELAERDGTRQFKVQGKPVVALKAVEVKGQDGKKHRQTQMMVNGQRWVPGTPTTTSGSTAGTAAVSAPRDPFNDEPPPQPQGAKLPPRQPAPVAAAAESQDDKRAAGWELLGEEYATALLLARRGFTKAGVTLPDAAVLQAAAATLMIQADRSGTLPFVGMLERMRGVPVQRESVDEEEYAQRSGHRTAEPMDDPFAEVPVGLQEGPDNDGLPF